MLSSGMFSALAASIAVRSRGLPAGSPPPCLAAMVISRISLVDAAPPRAPRGSVPAGSDAGQLELPSPDAVNTVAAWFRLALPMNGWTLQSDARAADGTVSIYAQKGTKPLWISLKPSVGAPGTTYTMIGAAVDSTKADSGR